MEFSTASEAPTTLNNNHHDHHLTQLLHAWHNGDSTAGDALFRQVYQALKAIASNRLRCVNASIQTTELAHEGFLLLSHKEAIDWQDRKHFFAIAANAVRRLLVDRARASHAQKRGGGAQYIPLDDIQIPVFDHPIDWIELDDLFKELEQMDEILARTLELRLIMGLTVRETSEVLEVSTATVSRKWNFGLAWLHDHLPGLAIQPDL